MVLVIISAPVVCRSLVFVEVPGRCSRSPSFATVAVEDSVPSGRSYRTAHPLASPESPIPLNKRI